MNNIFDYLKWRGDIPFERLGPNPVDGLIFSTLAYVHYDGCVPEQAGEVVTLQQAAENTLLQPNLMERCRVEKDLELLKAAAATRRFGSVGMTFYQNVFEPDQDTQFGAVSFLPGEGSAVLAFRGTDNSLVGWREDFNMAFEDSVPAQRLARDYVSRFARVSRAPLILGGHSKGGNLAVYAGACVSPRVQKRIRSVLNFDGPGFTEGMLTQPGYLAIVPRICTYLPECSVFGLLLEREEPFQVIRSRQIGLLQHDPYYWEVLGPDFVPGKELTQDSRFLDRTLKNWLAGMNRAERNEFVDAVFGLLMVEDNRQLRDILRPQNLPAYLKMLHMDENRRKVITSELKNLVESARNAGLVQEEWKERQS